MIVPGWAKWLGVLLLLVGTLIGLGYYLSSTISENKQLKSEMKAFNDRLLKAEDANVRQDNAFVKRDELHTENRNGVADVTVRIQQEKARDSETAAVLGTRLPDGLRKAILGPTGPAAEREGSPGTNPDRGGTPIK